MNFSKNHSLSRLLSLILVLCLVSTLFTGCLGSPEETSEPPKLDLDDTPSTSTQDTTPPTTEAVEINENTATVISQLNIRSAPSTEANVVGTLYAGDRVEISRREVLVGIDWAYIISPQAGWIVMEYVKMDIPTEGSETGDTSTPAGNGDATVPATTEPTTGSNNNTNSNTSTGTTTNIRGVITASGLNIRSEASTNGTVQGSYSKGDVVTILETKDGWGRTNKGWISMQYVNTSGSTTGTTNNNNSTTTGGNTTGTTTGNGSTTVQFKGIVTASELNVRSSASTEGTRVGSLAYGDRVEILEKSGNWGRIKDGWISLDYVYQDGTKGTKATGGIVTGNALNVRSGPGTAYGSVGSLNAGDRVDVLEQFTYNGTTWGCIKNGWISMEYVYVDGSGTGNDKTGTVTGDNLNVRSGPGTGYGSVGSLDSGDRVTILYQVTVGSTTWGNIQNGWISMDYVDLD